MQACPYDALYLDPNTHTAAKCNFCAHRIEMNLEPACVIVCPTRAIIAGDIDDPESDIGQIIATGKVAARKPQKGTRPKLFYTGIEGDFLQPSMLEAQSSYSFADRDPRNPHPTLSREKAGEGQKSRPTLRHGPGLTSPAVVAANEQKAPSPHLSRKIAGEEPILAGEGPATQADGHLSSLRVTQSNPGAARVVYDVAHPQPWGLIPAFYLWTKSIAAGLLIVAALLLGFASPSIAGSRMLLRVAAPAAALIFTAITTLLLIADLHRPERFYYILLKPNPRSWLVIGTWILILYSIIAAVWLAFGIISAQHMLLAIIVPGAVLGACSAGYSAFLFAQAKGRDLWQSPLFLWHLIVQAIIGGAAILIVLIVLNGYPHIAYTQDGGFALMRATNLLLIGGIVLSLLMIIGELLLTPFSTDAHYAADFILRGRLRNIFWFGVVAIGSIAPSGILIYLLTSHASMPLEVIAAVLGLAGLLIFEKVWIEAGQAPPLS